MAYPYGADDVVEFDSGRPVFAGSNEMLPRDRLGEASVVSGPADNSELLDERWLFEPMLSVAFALKRRETEGSALEIVFDI